jgi:LuxR family maltose regulon positive regulatory protein
LEKLNAGLCDHLPGGNHNAASGRSLLDTVRRANLFLIPLDIQHDWFRYHHLFADLLRGRLRETQPQLEALIHAAASSWYEANDMVEDALRHAVSGKDWERAAQLVETHWRRPVEAGEYETAAGWFQALPPERLHNRPRLALAYCWVLWLKGQINRLEEWLLLAEQALEQPEQRARNDYTFDQGQAALMRAIVLRHQGDVPASVRSAEQASRLAENMPPPSTALERTWDLLFRGVTAFHLGESLRMLGDAVRAAPAFQRSIEILAPFSPVAVCGAYYNLCSLLILQGQLRRAAEPAERTGIYRQLSSPKFACIRHVLCRRGGNCLGNGAGSPGRGISPASDDPGTREHEPGPRHSLFAFAANGRRSRSARGG